MQTALTISFDPATQAVGVQINPAVVKNWDFALAILGMAKLAGEDARRQHLLQNMQKQALAAQQEQAVRRALKV